MAQTQHLNMGARPVGGWWLGWWFESQRQTRGGTPGSTPLLFVGEPVFGQNLLSRFANVPMTGCSKFVLVPPLPEHGLEESECDSSWWDGLPCESCFGVWLKGGGRDPLVLWSGKVGPRTEPFSK